MSGLLTVEHLSYSHPDIIRAESIDTSGPSEHLRQSSAIRAELADTSDPAEHLRQNIFSPAAGVEGQTEVHGRVGEWITVVWILRSLSEGRAYHERKKDGG